MGWLSTYTQSIIAPNGVEGMSLKDKLIEDGYIRQKSNGEYSFNLTKANIQIKINHDFFTDDLKGLTCFARNDNALSCDFNIHKNGDFVDLQLDGAKSFSMLYPGTLFSIHSSYCPGGCGLRRTALDEYVTNGEITDSKGIPCESSLVTNKRYFHEQDDIPQDCLAFDMMDGSTAIISRDNIEDMENGLCRIYQRKDDAMMRSVFSDCEELNEIAEREAIDAMYDIDDEAEL